MCGAAEKEMFQIHQVNTFFQEGLFFFLIIFKQKIFGTKYEYISLFRQSQQNLTD